MSEDASAVKQAVEGASADFRGTLTNIAIDKAGVELRNHGRDYAQSVLIVFTDGYPESRERTMESSKAFQQMGSYPWQDNLLAVENFESLAARQTLDRLIP